MPGNRLPLAVSVSRDIKVFRTFKRLGNGGYVAAILTSLADIRYETDHMRLDDGRIIGQEPYILASISNSQFTGGAMQIAPSARVDDGELDIVIVGKMSRSMFLRTFPKIYQGKLEEHQAVQSYRAASVEFLKPRRQDILVDGELRTLTIERVSVLPKAMEVLA